LRLAIGAQRRDVVRLILGEAIALLVVGMAVGVPLALTSARVLVSILFELTSADVPSLVVAAGVLTTVSLVASYVPVRRAAHVDPIAALRGETTT